MKNILVTLLLITTCLSSLQAQSYHKKGKKKKPAKEPITVETSNGTWETYHLAYRDTIVPHNGASVFNLDAEPSQQIHNDTLFTYNHYGYLLQRVEKEIAYWNRQINAAYRYNYPLCDVMEYVSYREYWLGVKSGLDNIVNYEGRDRFLLQWRTKP